MTKIMLCAAALLAAAETTYGQPYVRRAQNKLTAGPDARPVARLTGATKRVFDLSNSGLMVADSTYFTYGAGTGYDYILKDWKYENAVKLNNTLPVVSYEMDERVHRTFDTKNRIAMMEIQQWKNNNWEAVRYETFSYTPGGQLEVYKIGEVNTPDSARYTYTYNAAGLPAIELTELWDDNASQWRNGTRKNYHYNANNENDTIITQKWYTSPGAWQYESRTVMGYAAGKVSSRIFAKYHNGPTWTDMYKAEFTYNPAGLKVQADGYQPDGAGWRLNDVTSYTYSNAGELLTEELIGVDQAGPYNVQRYTRTYTAQHQLETELLEHWSSTEGKYVLGSADYEMRYYYEMFTNSVADAVSIVTGFNIYPNPVHTTLHCNIKLDKAATTTLRLFDMSGRLVYNTVLPGAPVQSAAIDVAALPAGTYVLHAQANGEVMTSKVVVQ